VKRVAKALPFYFHKLLMMNSYGNGKWVNVAFNSALASTRNKSGPGPLAQQIVQYLKNKALHRFRLCMPDGKTVILKGILLLVAIAHLCLLFFPHVENHPRHRQRTSYSCILESSGLNIISRGMVPTWTGRKLGQVNSCSICDLHSTNDLSTAVKRPQGTAPKQKTLANYASIGDDTLRDLLQSVMWV